MRKSCSGRPRRSTGLPAPKMSRTLDACCMFLSSPACIAGELRNMQQASNVRDILGAGNPVDRLGRPLHDLRISVMDRCNFRCPYCMPKEQFHEHYRFLKSQERLSFDEIVRLARLFGSLGVRKLRLTGGEPL